MSGVSNPMLRGAVVLALFAVIGTGLVSLTNEVTHQRIVINERNALLSSLKTVIASVRYDNDIYLDTIEIVDPGLFGTTEPMTAYRARREGEPVAIVMTPVAPDGRYGHVGTDQGQCRCNAEADAVYHGC